MKKYLSRFLKEEDGAEFLEFSVVIGLVAILVAVIVVIVLIVKNKALQAGKAIDEAGTNSTIVDWDQQINEEEINEALENLN